MPKVVKFWHQWSWLFHILWALVLGTMFVATYMSDTKANTSDIAAIRKQHDDENLKERMAVQEKTAADIRDDVRDIKATQGAIFNRINQIADREHK